MSRIESSIQDLVVSLEELSARAERQLLDAADGREQLAATRRKARTAQTATNSVALELAAVIGEMKDLLARIDETATDAPAQK